MKVSAYISAVLVLCVAAASNDAADNHGGATKVPGYIQAAVDDSSRPEADRMRDVNRKPAQVLSFAGIQPGAKVGELAPGQGYYTRLLCRVVGDTGHVDTINFKIQMPPRPPPPGVPAMPPPAPLGCHNVTEATQDTSALKLPSGLDVVWTTENYHDFHSAMFGSPDMRKFDQAIYDSLKPGGIFIIEDHAAPTGSGVSDTDTLHRIDPTQVMKEVQAVGFKFVGQSRALRNPADDHTTPVFKMGGKTDKFLFKFQKPAA
jgi:predicted methyltransferase